MQFQTLPAHRVCVPGVRATLRLTAVASALGLALLAGCGGGGGSGGNGDAGPTVDAEPEGGNPPAPPAVNLIVDANRDGELDATPGTDDEGEAEWTDTAGAVFLVNIDDDDSNKQSDASDNVVNGPGDELDLARIQVAAWPEAPELARGTLSVDTKSRAFVRLFRRTGTEWTNLTITSPVMLSAADLRAGVEFAIEAKDFIRTRTQPWQGDAEITLTVSEDGVELGRDEVALRAAPWFVNHNLRPFDRVYYSDFSDRLTGTLGPVLEKYSVSKFNLPANDFNGTSDIWFEDWMQTGWTAMPAIGGGGAPHGMIVFNARPWGREEGFEPIKLLRQRFLAPDQGVAAFYSEAFETNVGSTFDSHGNHDALPPYPGAPLGRLFTGSGALPSTMEFYAAQKLQPPIAIDTSWLAVGHIDEVYATVKAQTDTGFKMIENAPDLGRALFEGWQTAGHGAAVIFEGMVDFENLSWQTDVDSVLNNASLMAWSQEAQVEIDDMRADLIQKAGLTEADFVKVPVLYEELDGGKVAYLPDTANVRVIEEGEVAIFPQTHGPVIESVDAFEAALVEILTDPDNELGGEDGLTVEFGDSFDYHVLLGDIHCASNWTAPPTDDGARWWIHNESSP
jgi:protein-arginine deiminase